MNQFKTRIMKLMETDNLDEACSGLIKISESEREFDSVCICVRKIKHANSVYNETLYEIEMYDVRALKTFRISN